MENMSAQKKRSHFCQKKRRKEVIDK